MSAVDIYHCCISRELITAFNRSGLCISYKAMKEHRCNLAKYAVLKESISRIPLQSHFSNSKFTTAAIYNFNHADRNSLSGTACANDTVMTEYQTVPQERPSKSARTEMNLKNVHEQQELNCQELIQYRQKTKMLKIPGEFVVSEGLYKLTGKEKQDLHSKVISLLMGRCSNSNKQLPSWSGIKSLLSDAYVPVMQVGFLPFLPHPVNTSQFTLP